MALETFSQTIGNWSITKLATYVKAIMQESLPNSLTLKKLVVTEEAILPAAGAIANNLPSSGLYEGLTVSVLTDGKPWQFVYLPSSDATYPWHFISGDPLRSTSTTAQTLTDNAWNTVLSKAAPYAGVYLAHGETWTRGTANRTNDYRYGFRVDTAVPTTPTALMRGFLSWLDTLTATKDASLTFAVWQQQAFGDGGGEAVDRWLEITPVKVAG